jgi:hypothetical protein
MNEEAKALYPQGLLYSGTLQFAPKRYLGTWPVSGCTAVLLYHSLAFGPGITVPFASGFLENLTETHVEPLDAELQILTYPPLVPPAFSLSALRLYVLCTMFMLIREPEIVRSRY